MSVSPLTRYRLEQNLTLEQAAKLFGVKKAAVWKWEKKHVPADRMVSVSRITGISCEDLRPDLYEKETAA